MACRRAGAGAAGARRRSRAGRAVGRGLGRAALRACMRSTSTRQAGRQAALCNQSTSLACRGVGILAPVRCDRGRRRRAARNGALCSRGLPERPALAGTVNQPFVAEMAALVQPQVLVGRVAHQAVAGVPAPVSRHAALQKAATRQQQQRRRASRRPVQATASTVEQGSSSGGTDTLQGRRVVVAVDASEVRALGV